MDGLKDRSIHHTAIKICEDLQDHCFYKGVQNLVSSSNIKYDDFKKTFLKAMQSNGLEAELRNSIYHWVQDKKKDVIPCTSNSAFFKKAQIQWEKRIHKSLNSMCSELGINLAKMRNGPDRVEITEKWGELSNYDVDIHKYRPVYAPRDFLEVLLNLKDPNFKANPGEPKWDFSHLPLKVKDLSQLRQLYTEFSRGEQLMGVNLISTAPVRYDAFEMERIILGEKVLLKNHAPIAQEYLKRGCPRGLRAQLWTLVLGAQIKESHYAHFECLKAHVREFDLMMDKLIIKDVHLTASNDDQYFVFEDVLFQVMLCFSRDSEILESLASKPGFMQVVLKGKQGSPENTMVFPPSGVIPFHGFTMYAAPFCYLFDNPVAMYYVFRAFYLRYWFRLHRLCNHPQGIVSLSLLYEKLLQIHDPALWFHFKKNGIHPLRVVLKWLMRAFSGHLPPEQVMYLWDLILAYDSLELIPVLAVAILMVRRNNLLKVTNIQNIDTVLADLSSVVVMPLLQISLMKD